MNLLGIDTNAKTVKGQKKGYMTGIMYLAPANESGVMNTCADATEGCKATCLFSAGRGNFANVKKSRITKTVFLKSNKKEFVRQLMTEVDKLHIKAHKTNMIPCVRLNGTSDLPIENFGIIQTYPTIQFYDYTKSIRRMKKFLAGEMPSNYHLTFSRSEKNAKHCEFVLANGGNVAVVFKKVPKTWDGFEVIDGDESDLRFLDGQGKIIGLKAKGKARKLNCNGFVI